MPSQDIHHIYIYTYTDKLNSQLELIQMRALRIVFGQYDIDALMAQYNIPSLDWN